VVLHVPDNFFGSVGTYYKDFPEVTDEEVRGLMSAYQSTSADDLVEVLMEEEAKQPREYLRSYGA
jgi:hypothetical protein